MKYYQEITLLPDQEISLNFIWPKVFHQLHLAFANAADKAGRVPFGVSFPGYTMEDGNIGLGNKLRVFSPDGEMLDGLELHKKLSRLEDYVHVVRRPRTVPEEVRGYSCYSRLHQEANGLAKARRYARRHDISVDEAEKLFPPNTITLKEPYIRLDSSSTGQKMLLFIRKTEAAQQMNGSYSTYGLSDTATVPEF